MVTPLERPLRRAITIDGEPYVVTLTPEGLRLVQKGHRKGQEIPWREILAGGVTLTAQLVRSLAPEAADKTTGRPAAGVAPRREK